MATSSGTFKLEIGQNCFLCFSSLIVSQCDKISNGNGDSPINVSKENEENDDIENPQIDQSSVEYSLLTICRYLKLNLKEIFKECRSREDENRLFKEFSMVSLCAKCGKFVEQLTELCRELEVMKMRVDDKLRIFQTYFETQNCQPRNDGHDSQLENSLRIRLKKSCDNKLKRLLPRIELKAYEPIQQTQEINSTLEAEPIVVKMEYEETNIQNNLEETSTLISTQSNLIKGLPHQRQCNLCSMWVHKNSLYRHKTKNCMFKVTSNKELHECKICIKSFGESTSLRKHIRSAHPSTSAATGGNIKVNEVKCEHCDRMINKNNMRRHLAHNCPNYNIEHPATDPLGETELERHLLKLDSSTSSEKCDLCGKMISKRRMSVHKRVWCKFGPRQARSKPRNRVILSAKNFSMLNNGKAKCNQCGATVSKFGTWRHTNMHCPFGPRIPNPESKPRACDICGEMFNSSFNMYRHKKRFHPGHANMPKINSVMGLVSIKCETTTETNGLN